MSRYDIAAYVWPSYTGDELRSRIFWPEGYGEWETVKAMKPRFEGHNWPRKPLWGYVNEADPYIMEMQIGAAADHGVNTFIYDWYWFDHAPFLEQCLDNGFLGAKNNSRMKFYLMWANHNANSMWDRRNADLYAPIWDGACDRRDFETVVHRVIEKYFLHPSYYKIDGKPVFMIHDLWNLVRGLGSLDGARSAIDCFRNETVKAGLPGLELQAEIHSVKRLLEKSSLEGVSGSFIGILRELGFDSATNYQFFDLVEVSRDYSEVFRDVLGVWDYYDRNLDIPYYPHVSVGWDPTVRYTKFHSDIVYNNTVDEVRKAFLAAKAYVDTHKNLKAPLITVNSWNEWTEGSYLEPDNLNGYAFLDLIKEIFLPKE